MTGSSPLRSGCCSSASMPFRRGLEEGRTRLQSAEGSAWRTICILEVCKVVTLLAYFCVSAKSRYAERSFRLIFILKSFSVMPVMHTISTPVK